MDDHQNTTVGDTAEAEVTAQPAPQAPRKTKKGPKAHYIKIELAENDEIPPSGLFLSVNDRAYLLQPGMEADVPPGVVDVLDNAVMATPRIDPQTKRVVGYKERLRYPYRRL